MLTELNLFTIRDAGHSFIISMNASGRYKETYLIELERAVAYLAAFAEENGWPDISRITTAHIEEYLVELRQRPLWFGLRRKAGQTTISQAYFESQYRRLKTFWGWLKRRGHTETNVLDLIPHPKGDQKVVATVSEAQLEGLLGLLKVNPGDAPSFRFRNARNRAALFTFIDTPGRLNEIARVNLNSVDLDAGTFTVLGKGGRERQMVLGATGLESMFEYILLRSKLEPRTDDLWVDFGGLPMATSWLYLMIKRLGKRAGIPSLHPHQFRHTFAVWWVKNQGNTRLLEAYGGWRAIPQTYLRTIEAADAHEFSKLHSHADAIAREPRKPDRRLLPRRRGGRGRL